MDKKRLILLIILLLAIVLIVLGVKGNVFKENRQNMELRSSGDDNSHWFHLSGVVVEKTFDTLLIELNEKEESRRIDPGQKDGDGKDRRPHPLGCRQYPLLRYLDGQRRRLHAA